MLQSQGPGGKPTAQITEYQCLFITAALVLETIVLILSCPYSGIPLQSNCSDWFLISLSLHQACPYEEPPYIKR